MRQRLIERPEAIEDTVETIHIFGAPVANGISVSHGDAVIHSILIGWQRLDIVDVSLPNSK